MTSIVGRYGQISAADLVDDINAEAGIDLRNLGGGGGGGGGLPAGARCSLQASDAPYTADLDTNITGWTTLTNHSTVTVNGDGYHIDFADGGIYLISAQINTNVNGQTDLYINTNGTAGVGFSSFASTRSPDLSQAWMTGIVYAFGDDDIYFITHQTGGTDGTVQAYLDIIQLTSSF